MSERAPFSSFDDNRVWLWLAGGLAVALGGAALALWAAYGPAVFINSLNAAWTCL